jgi:two-component system nitrogen regulation response regulator GlnG
VRELENLCQWITVMAPGQQVEVGDLPAELREPEAAAPATESDGSPGSAVPCTWWTGRWAWPKKWRRRLRAGEVGIIDDLTRRFEESCIRTGLAHTGGRKVEAAHCWAGAATLTRKIQELGMEGQDEHADHV